MHFLSMQIQANTSFIIWSDAHTAHTTETHISNSQIETNRRHGLSFQHPSCCGVAPTAPNAMAIKSSSTLCALHTPISDNELLRSIDKLVAAMEFLCHTDTASNKPIVFVGCQLIDCRKGKYIFSYTKAFAFSQSKSKWPLFKRSLWFWRQLYAIEHSVIVYRHTIK